MNPTRISGVNSDDFFIIPNSEDVGNKNDVNKDLCGLSKDPYLHGTFNKCLQKDYHGERSKPFYDPKNKEDTYTLKGWKNGRLTELRRNKHDPREAEDIGVKLPVQRHSKTGDNLGRTGRPSTHYSLKQQKRFKDEMCRINTEDIIWRPYFVTLTSTPYVYELRESGVTNAVSDFCKGGLLRWKERLRRHRTNCHLTGMYKWEHTVSELPHLHWLAWFARWEGDPNTPENKMLDYDWMARTWFECLFPTPELREKNSKHLKAGTQTARVRGYSKKNKRVKDHFPENYTTEQLENDLQELRQESELTGKGGAWEKSCNYIAKYIGKEESDVPEGWGGTFTGYINRNAFRSFQEEEDYELGVKEGEQIHKTMVIKDNERITKHVEMSKNLDYLIERNERKIYIEDDIEEEGDLDLDFDPRLLKTEWEREKDEHEKLGRTDWLTPEQNEEHEDRLEAIIIKDTWQRFTDDDVCDETNGYGEWDFSLIDEYPDHFMSNETGVIIKRRRNFLHKWKKNEDDKGKFTGMFNNVVVNDDENELDANGNPKRYVLEFIDYVYDTDGNFIGVYEAITTKTKVYDEPFYVRANYGDPEDWINVWASDFEMGIDDQGYMSETKFVLHNEGDVIEEHDEWTGLKARRLGNEDEYRYKSFKSLRGLNHKDLLRKAFPNCNFIEKIISVKNISLDKNNTYFKKEKKICLTIQQLAIKEQIPLLE